MSFFKRDGANMNDRSSLAPWKREQEARQQIQAKLDAEAKARTPSLLAEQPARLRSFQDDHAADLAAYRFRCERYGDFLSVFITRPTCSVYLKKAAGMLSHSLNLGATTGIEYRGGNPSNLEGVATFVKYQSDKRAHVFQPEVFEKRKLASRRKDYMQFHHHNGYHNFSGFKSECMGVAQPAVDDIICFSGIDTEIYAPFGRGHEVYSAILAAIKLGARESAMPVVPS